MLESIKSFIDNYLLVVVVFLLGFIIAKGAPFITGLVRSFLSPFRLLGRVVSHVMKTYVKAFSPLSGSDVMFAGLVLIAIRDIYLLLSPYDHVRQFEVFFVSQTVITWVIFSGALLYLSRRVLSSKKDT